MTRFRAGGSEAIQGSAIRNLRLFLFVGLLPRELLGGAHASDQRTCRSGAQVT
jgi:hypothetical protein